jgi:flagellar hook assembly protein FlgD
LTKDATIEIFSLAGERVKKVEVESGSLSATWDGRQEDGKEIAGGMYIYVVRNDRDKVVGKIVVVR